jgi:outer membrane putative beta-barrel porin/alpha-amylase
MRLPLIVTFGATLLFAAPFHVRAQKVSEVIPTLLEEKIRVGASDKPDVLVNPALANARGPTTQDDHRTHFFKSEQQDQLNRVGALINAAVATQLTTYPVGYSSGGFTYTFDPTTNTDRRTSPSFGPSFAERPQTIGRGHWNFAANYQRMTFDSLDGRDLTGQIHFYFQHNDCCGQPPGGTPNVPVFEEDIIETTLNMELSADIVALSANYGVTNRFDVGVVVPIAHIDMNASLGAQLFRLGSENSPNFPAVGGTPIHTFPGGSLLNPDAASASASATGIGDMLVRAKYGFLSAHDGEAGAAVALDLRLPTGDEENLLGTGTTQARISFIGSTALGRFYPHVNVGYTISGKGFVNEIASDLQQPDEANYVFGFDSAVTSTLTVAADIVGRTLLDPSGFTDQSRTFQCVSCPPLSPTFDEFSPSTGNTNILLGSAGVRFNPVRNLLISAHALFPLRKSGLVDNFTPVIGFEYAF